MSEEHTRSDITILENRISMMEKTVSGYSVDLVAAKNEIKELKGGKAVYMTIAIVAIVTLGVSFLLTETRVQGVQAGSRSELAHNRELLADIKTRKLAENVIQDRHLHEHEREFGHRAITEHVKTIETKLEILGKSFDEHEKQGFHPQAAIKSTELDQRLKVVEADIKNDEDTFTGLQTGMTKLTGLTERAHLLISTNTEKIGELHTSVNKNQSRLSSIAASTESGFVEVETQLRSILEVLNVRWQGMKTIQAMIYREAFGKSLPEEDFYPSKIPADATSATGRINGNSNGH